MHMFLLPLFLLMPHASAASFPDVPEDYVDAVGIHWFADKKVINGYPDGLYHPDRNVNRAEFAKIMALGIVGEKSLHQFFGKCFGLDTEELSADMTKDTLPSFKDVDRKAWYWPYVCALTRLQVISGYPDGTFKPEQSISFAEGAKMLAKSLIPNTGNAPVSDPWYRSSVEFLEKVKAIPRSIDRFDHLLTRGETAGMIYRSIGGNHLLASETYAEVADPVNTSSWKVFKNKAYGFQISYPPEAGVGSNTFATDPENAFALVVGPIDITVKDPAQFKGESLTMKPFTTAEFMELPLSDYVSGIFEINYSEHPDSLSQPSSSEVGGKKGFEFRILGPFKDEQGSLLVEHSMMHVYTERNGLIYLFAFMKEDEHVARAMLRTFK